ncbi:MAG TPA: ABC transporter permease, partial [Methylomirabilota bacterium]
MAFGVSVLVFALVHLSGDPVLLMVSSDAPPDVVDTTRRALGFDRPLYQQLAQYLVRAAQGDLGVSLRSQRPVAALIAERLPATVELTLAALLIAV